MADLTQRDKNALRKAIRLLEMRENRGDPTYDATCDEIAASLREMILPTEKFELHFPEELPLTGKVVYYETDGAGVKHLWLSVKEKRQRRGANGHEADPPAMPNGTTAPAPDAGGTPA
jgi:hypothetical protein